MTPEDRYQIAKLGAAASNARRTPEQWAEFARKGALAANSKRGGRMAGLRVLIRKTKLCYMLLRDTEATVLYARGKMLRVLLPDGTQYWVNERRCEVLG